MLRKSRKTAVDSLAVLDTTKPLVNEHLRPLHVLLADDNEFNQKIVSRILSTLSCMVLPCSPSSLFTYRCRIALTIS